MSQQSDEEFIFNAARKIEDLQARAEYLSQACGGDEALLNRVKSLLESHQAESQFLEVPAESPTLDSNTRPEKLGTKIGRYKLLQEIGTGGFGVVYMAEQTQPVRRKIALKIIKAGMDTKEVVARFEAERQALAMMDHPNIAQVHDGGATETGRPYFVMELVKGVPITEFCDKNKYTPDQRLRLFLDVCHAVQHAHQKGIIHRDLKPSNVLVTLADGKPIVKVIDFGIAKATNQQLTQRTLFTAFGQMVGTPQYMSPEQAEMSCLDVDTRSDVYALGVLLYELLTGTTPVQAERLRTAGYAEMQRIIKEEEPPKPSNRLSTSGEQLTVIADKRCISPDKLMSQVRGDLDWIVMKTLEKDRNRRYESASNLAADVLNYLNDEPVEARPPTIRYRVGKYVRKNRVAIGVTALLIVSMGLGLIGTTRNASVARRRLGEIESQKLALLDEAKKQTIIYALQGDLDEAATKLELAKTLGAERTWVTLREGQIALQAAEYDKARALLQQATEQLPSSTAAYSLRLICEYFSGYEHSYLMQVGSLKDQPASEFEDYLFRGLAQTWAHPKRAVDDLQKAVEDEPHHAIVHLVLASALRLLAADMPNARDAYDVATQAIGEAITAKTMLPDNAFAMTELIHSHIVLANICEKIGPEFDIERAATIETARLAVNKSKSIEPYNSMLHRARIYFFNQFGERDDEAAELLANVPVNLGQMEEHSDVVFRRAWMNLRCDELELAQKELDSMGGLFAQSYLVPQALIDTADASPEQFLDLQNKYRKLLNDPQRDSRGLFGHHDWAIARILLLDEIATQRGESFREVIMTLNYDYANDFLPLAKYLSGDRTVEPDDIIRGLENSNRLFAENLFLLGVDSLANGNRLQARRHFEDCLATNYYEFFVYWWSQAMLERLDDENWLPWLPNLVTVDSTGSTND